MTKYKRDILFSVVNKEQERILYPFYAACLLLLLCFVMVAGLMMDGFLSGTGKYATLVSVERLSLLNQQILVVGGIFGLVFCALIYWAFFITNKILGPYERIVRELDLVLSGKKRTAIKVRENGGMFSELLKRVNILISERVGKERSS